MRLIFSSSFCIHMTAITRRRKEGLQSLIKGTFLEEAAGGLRDRERRRRRRCRRHSRLRGKLRPRLFGVSGTDGGPGIPGGDYPELRQPGKREPGRAVGRCERQGASRGGCAVGGVRPGHGRLGDHRRQYGSRDGIPGAAGKQLRRHYHGGSGAVRREPLCSGCHDYSGAGSRDFGQHFRKDSWLRRLLQFL